VTVLQPASGTVVLPGQSVTCSGRATGHGGLLTAVVDRVVLNLDGGSGIEAGPSPRGVQAGDVHCQLGGVRRRACPFLT